MILENSFHNSQHTIVTFQNYCFGAHNISLNKNDLNKEIKIIKTIAKNNGYQTELIDKIIKNLENKKAKLKDENKYRKTDKISN